MPCRNGIDELMSLKLDGVIDSENDRILAQHLQSCEDCSILWTYMKKADGMLVASARRPLPVPASFHLKVMTRIATSAAPTPAIEMDPIFQPGMAALAHMPVYTTAPTRRLEESPTGYLAAYAEWQHRIASYARGIAAVGLSIAGTVGLLLALVLSGTIKLSGPAGDVADTIRTFFQAADTWTRSLLVNFGPGLLAVGSVMIGILLLVGWQVISGYHHSALENRGNTGVLEAA